MYDDVLMCLAVSIYANEITPCAMIATHLQIISNLPEVKHIMVVNVDAYQVWPN